MNIFTDDLQRQLLIAKGLERLTRNDLANEIGVSFPTMTRLINSKTPFAIHYPKQCLQTVDQLAI